MITHLLPRGMLETADEDLISRVASAMGGWFGLVMYDEVHFLKNTNSPIHRAAELLYAEEKFFLTGTPIINRSIDLVGTLQLF